MKNEAPRASGVQELIERIRDDGVEAGREKADEIISEARREAARLLSEAQAQAAATHHKASEEIESFRHAALEALKLAARDTRLQLEAAVLAAFEGHVKRLVEPVAYDGSFVRAMVMVLAGQVADQYPEDQELQILVSDMLFGREAENEKLDKKMRDGVLGISHQMLREGVEIIPSHEVSGGARVRVVGEDLEFDLTEEALSKLLMKHLLPRYRSILEGTE
jgi:V/A-type H+-transporting ATPase subunit E